ncbi:mRNA binding protein puf3 [Tulasnella sp. JGI-2019a]|nr:mRNA binding protein puf3 [Tulasnella sp. JGI-2019a]
MTSVGEPTSRKPSGSSTHSGVHSTSASPSSRPVGRRNTPSAIYTGLTSNNMGFKNQGPSVQDPRSLNLAQRRAVTVGQTLSAPASRYDSASSPARSNFNDFSNHSSYSTLSGGLPQKPTSYPGSMNHNQRGGGGGTDQGVGIRDSSGGNYYGQQKSQASYPHGAVMQNGMPIPAPFRPDYYSYYGSPTAEHFGEYHAFSPTMYASPPLPGPGPYEYGSSQQTPMAGPPDALRSPTGGYFPGNGPASQYQGGTYYYPTPSQAFMLGAPPQSPYATSHFPVAVTSSDLDSKKRQLQDLQHSVQQQHQQLSHQQQSLMMAIQQHPPVSPMSPTYPSSFPRYPSTGMPIPQTQSARSSGYWPTSPGPASTKRLSGSFKGLLTPKSTRRGNPDGTESSIDSGVGLRSALLEQFRADKSGNWQLRDVVGKIVEFSGDQHGSRFIQEKIQTAKPEEKQRVFDEIVPDHALQLMSDVFGNYVIQKLFEHGTGPQKDEMVAIMTGHMLSLTLQMYGCRVVQKAIENITPEQQSSLVEELEHHVLDCVKDANGNHVIQKIIQCVPGSRISLVQSFRGNVAFMASHPYGCRVLQRCFEWMPLEQTRPLLDELHTSTTALMQDGFGNYVVQFVLERGGPEDRSAIVHKLLGHVLTMARHKFASNVVEKAILTADMADRRMLIDEILVQRPDGQMTILTMMKDQYANYVLQRALAAADRDQLIDLCAKIRPQLLPLRRYSSTFTKHLVAIEKLMNQRLPLQPLAAPPGEVEARRHSFHEYRSGPATESNASQ